MKKLGILVVVLLGINFFYPELFSGILSFGGNQYGLSDDDPLGVPSKLDQALAGFGFTLDQGSLDGSGEATYISQADNRLYEDFPGALKVSVGDDDYVYKISAAFVSTQHGYSPARMTATERFMSLLWKKVIQSKPEFKKIKRTMGSVFGIKIPDNRMEAQAHSGDVSGRWMYSENSPMEFVELKIK